MLLRHATLLLSLAPRSPPPRLALLPEDDIGGISLERQLGELTFAEVSSTSRDAEAVLAGAASPTRVGPQQVSVGLYYGQLTAMNVRGTRCLVKRYGAEANNALQQRQRQGAVDGAAERARLEREKAAAVAAQDFLKAGELLDAINALEQQPPPSRELDADAARRALEAALEGRGGVSVAEALAANEYAAHCRVQALSGVQDVEQAGLLRLLGRQSPRDVGLSGDEPAILHAFPWRGEQVRMALPTSLPPTLGSWAVARANGATPGAKYDASVPRQGLQERGRFVRAALRGALCGLRTLHAADLVHQSLSPQSVLLSSEDDRKAERAKGSLAELGFCRDAPSLELCYRAAPDGAGVLPAYEGTIDVLDAGLLERAARKCVRPGCARLHARTPPRGWLVRQRSRARVDERVRALVCVWCALAQRPARARALRQGRRHPRVWLPDAG